MPRTRNMREIAEQMEAFEATASVPGTPTGSRRDGGKFEDLCLGFWDAVAAHCVQNGATIQGGTLVGQRGWTGLAFGGRSIWLPVSHGQTGTAVPRINEWVKTTYAVTALVDRYPGTKRAIEAFSPASGHFAGEKYPLIFQNLTTGFDGSIIFVRDGILIRKMLLEYKTAKASAGTQIDGNAHERLSFQIMQYLEVATQYPAASFCVIANGAYLRYRNKYHVNFKIQAERLRCFAWFDMNFMCTSEEFMRLAEKCERWLFSGEDSE